MKPLAESLAGESSALIAREFAALLRFLRGHGCSFHPCVALGEAPVPRGVSFRYDVHLRDLPAAHSFLALHRGEDVPATFYLLWDYSPVERKRLDQFCAFAAKVGAPVEIGLHDSPVDALLIESKFQNDRKAYVTWMRSGAAMEWLTALMRDPDALGNLHAQTLERFVVRVNKTKELFGPIVSVASHGGQIGQFRKSEKTLKPEIAALLRSLEARGWLTKERVTAAGLMADVESYRTGPSRAQASDNGGRIAALVRKLNQALADRDAVQLLLHPYTWDGATRDAEISALLNIE
jgi:hypothetical protein